MQRALAAPGFAGVLAYSLREALWLVREGVTDDVVMGYPTVDRGALATCSPTRRPRPRITLMVDDPAHLASSRPAPPSVDGVRVAIDIDAGLRLGRSARRARSARRCTTRARWSSLRAREVVDRGFSLVGVMTYEGQVAGVPDDVPHQRARSLVVRKLKAASVAQLEERRTEIAAGAARRGRPGVLERRRLGQRRVHRGRPGRHRGRGRVRPAGAGPVRPLRELRAATGGVLRRPGRTPARRRARRRWPAAGSSPAAPAGKDRLPIPWAPPDLHLTGLEGAGRGADAAHRAPGARCCRSATGCGSGTPSPVSSPSTPTRCTCWPATRSSRRCRPTAASGWPGDARPPARLLPRSWRWRSSARRPSAGPAGLHRRSRRVGQDDAGRPASPTLATGAQVVHMDDLYPGWRGLPEVDAQLDGAAATPRPRTGRAPTGATTGWPESSPRGSRSTRCRCWSLEGVGCGASRFAALVDGAGLGRGAARRADGAGLARDGDAFAPHWEQWAARRGRAVRPRAAPASAPTYASTGRGPTRPAAPSR